MMEHMIMCTYCACQKNMRQIHVKSTEWIYIHNSFKCVYKYMMCVHIFIGMSDLIHMKI
jgi:hypothetical protein